MVDPAEVTSAATALVTALPVVRALHLVIATAPVAATTGTATTTVGTGTTTAAIATVVDATTETATSVRIALAAVLSRIVTAR